MFSSDTLYYYHYLELELCIYFFFILEQSTPYLIPLATAYLHCFLTMIHARVGVMREPSADAAHAVSQREHRWTSSDSGSFASLSSN